MALILKNVWQSVMHPLVIMNQRFIYTIILKVMIPIHFLSMDLPHFNNMKINQLYMLGNDLYILTPITILYIRIYPLHYMKPDNYNMHMKLSNKDIVIIRFIKRLFSYL